MVSMKSNSPRKRKESKLVTFKQMKEMQRKKEESHVGPGAHNPHKEFGVENNTRINFGVGRTKMFKDNYNPAPGQYQPNA